MVGTSCETVGSTTVLSARVAMLRAVADPIRWQVLERLLVDGGRCHCELEEALGVSPSRLSFHLRVLREAALVTTNRRGKLVEYQLDPAGWEALQQALPSEPAGAATMPLAEVRS